MPPLLILSAALQLICIVHAVRNHRPYWWIFILMAGSFIGIAAYVLAELLPGLGADRAARKALTGVHDRIDPERHKRAASRKLEVADTLENRLRLAEESYNSGDFVQAEEMYRSGLRGLYATDPALMLGLAKSQFALSRPQEARKTLEDLIAANPNYRSPEGHLLYARCMEAAGDVPAALHEYEAVAEGYAGEEARVRYALLLKQAGQHDKAREVFQATLKHARISPKHYQRAQREWIAIANREIAGL